MGKLNFTTSNALTKKLWDERLYRDIEKESYFSKFAGTGPDNIVHTKTQLEKSKGDSVTFGLRMRLTGAGVTDNEILEGNEESLTTYDYSLALKQYRHGVRDDGALTRQRAMFNCTEEMRDAIKTWGAEKLDQLHFDAVLTSPTKVAYYTTSYAVASAATAKAAMSASYPIVPKLISFAKAYASGAGDRAIGVPIRPVRVKGRDWYILLVNQEVAFDLKQNSTWQGAQQYAMDRGVDNPLFTGALGAWDGVIVHEHENVDTDDDGGGSTVHYAKCVLLGAQALCHAWGKRMTTVQKSFDYDNEIGIAVDMMTRVGKPVFNSLDYGSLGVYVSCTNF